MQIFMKQQRREKIYTDRRDLQRLTHFYGREILHFRSVFIHSYELRGFKRIFKLSVIFILSVVFLDKQAF